MSYTEFEKDEDLTLNYVKEKEKRFIPVVVFLFFAASSLLFPTVFPHLRPWIDYAPYLFLGIALIILIKELINRSKPNAILPNFIRFSNKHQAIFFEQAKGDAASAQLSYEEIATFYIHEKREKHKSRNRTRGGGSALSSVTVLYIAAIRLTDHSTLYLSLFKSKRQAQAILTEIETYMKVNPVSFSQKKHTHIVGFDQLSTTRNTVTLKWINNTKSAIFRYFVVAAGTLSVIYLIATNVLPHFSDKSETVLIVLLALPAFFILGIVALLAKTYFFVHFNRFQIELTPQTFSYVAVNVFTKKHKTVANLPTDKIEAFAFNFNGTNPNPDLHQSIYFTGSIAGKQKESSFKEKQHLLADFYKNQALYLMGHHSISIIALRNLLNEKLTSNQKTQRK